MSGKNYRNGRRKSICDGRLQRALRNILELCEFKAAVTERNLVAERHAARLDASARTALESTWSIDTREAAAANRAFDAQKIVKSAVVGGFVVAGGVCRQCLATFACETGALM